MSLSVNTGEVIAVEDIHSLSEDMQALNLP